MCDALGHWWVQITGYVYCPYCDRRMEDQREGKTPSRP